MIKQLEVLNAKLKAIDDKFINVNWGGCAVIAAFVSNTLRTTFPIMRITCSNGYWIGSNNNLDTIRKNLTNSLNKDEWTTNDLYFHHVWVEILVNKRWYALDATGVIPIKDMYKEWGVPLKGSFTHKEIQSLANQDDWNSSFNRSQIPEIKQYITKELSSI